MHESPKHGQNIYKHWSHVLNLAGMGEKILVLSRLPAIEREQAVSILRTLPKLVSWKWSDKSQQQSQKQRVLQDMNPSPFFVNGCTVTKENSIWRVSGFTYSYCYIDPYCRSEYIYIHVGIMESPRIGLHGWTNTICILTYLHFDRCCSIHSVMLLQWAPQKKPTRRLTYSMFFHRFEMTFNSSMICGVYIVCFRSPLGEKSLASNIHLCSRWDWKCICQDINLYIYVYICIDRYKLIFIKDEGGKYW